MSEANECKPGEWSYTTSNGLAWYVCINPAHDRCYCNKAR